MSLNSKILLEVLKSEEINKKRFPNRQPLIKLLIQETRLWPEIELFQHTYGGTEFRLFNKSIGHIHSNGMLDLPFVKDVRRQLLDEGLVEVHHVHQTISWVSKLIQSKNDLASAKSLLLLSYFIKGQAYFSRFEEASQFIHDKLISCQLTTSIFALDILSKQLNPKK